MYSLDLISACCSIRTIRNGINFNLHSTRYLTLKIKKKKKLASSICQSYERLMTRPDDDETLSLTFSTNHVSVSSGKHKKSDPYGHIRKPMAFLNF